MAVRYVYVLYHTYGPDEERDENYKLIGIYTTNARAAAAIDRVKDQPGFRTRQGGFEIIQQPLDQDGWSEGFVRVFDDGSLDEPE